MAREVYSFTKIEKKRTKAGIVSVALGIVSLAGLAVLLVLSVMCAGTLDTSAAGCSLLTLLAGLFGWGVAVLARSDDDVTGRFLTAGCVISIAAVAAHLLIMLLGMMIIIE